MSKHIGFIGLGVMGIPMSENIIKGGYKLTVYDVNKAATEQLAQRGMRVASSIIDLANEVDTVLISLPTPAIVKEVTTGALGLIHGSKIKTVVDLSTTGSSMAQEIHAALGAKGIQFIDSPVSGGRGGAVNGTLAVMVSGSKETYDRLSDILQNIGKLFFIGEKSGMAQTMKLTNNLLSAAAMAITSEAVCMGVKAGLDPKTMIEVINVSSGMSTATRDKFPKSILTRKFDYGFATALMFKDVHLCLQEGASLGVKMPVADAVHELWRQTNESYGGDKDFTHIIEVVEKSMGVLIQANPA